MWLQAMSITVKRGNAVSGREMVRHVDLNEVVFCTNRAHGQDRTTRPGVFNEYKIERVTAGVCVMAGDKCCAH